MKLTQKEIFLKITQVLTEFGVSRESIEVHADYAKDMGLDSLDLVGLVNQMEYFFNIYVPNTDLDKFTNMQNTARYILTAVQG